MYDPKKVTLDNTVEENSYGKFRGINLQLRLILNNLCFSEIFVHNLGYRSSVGDTHTRRDSKRTKVQSKGFK